MVVLETNIDDMNPQLVEHTARQLFKAGAKDVWSQPIYMKKAPGSPGHTRRVTLIPICLPGGDRGGLP